MKKLVSLCGAILLGGALSAEEHPYSVATLPTWNNHGHNVQWNYIFKNAGWAYTNIMESTTEMDWLVKNLDKFDLLFAPQLFGYRKAPYLGKPPIDMDKYAPAIAEWIKKGGCLFQIDANYPEPCFGLSWYKAMDPAMAVSAGLNKCVNGGPANAVEPLDSILFFPNKAEYGFSWNHMTVPDQEKTAWKILSRCQHGEPTLMIRRWGKGIVLITSNTWYCREFMENIKANQAFLEMGLSIVEAKTPLPLPGKNRFEITCANTSEKDISGKIILRVTPVVEDEKGKVVSEGTSSQYVSTCVLKASSKGVAVLECYVKERGRVHVELLVEFGGKSGHCINQRITLPELFTLHGTRYRNVLSKSRRFDEVKLKLSHYPVRDVGTNEMYAAVEVLNSRGTRVSEAKAAIGRGEAYIPVRISRTLQAGTYTARAKLFAKESKTPISTSECDIQIVDDVPGGTYFDEDMAMIVDQKPFFPLGIYHLGPNVDGSWDEVADIGFNVFNVFSYRGTRAMGDVRMLDVKTLWEQLPHRAPAACKAQGTELNTNPAALLWYTMDEPAEAKFDFVKSLDDAWHETDLHHPTFLVSYQPHHFKRNARISDILAPDCYPYHPSLGDNAPIDKVSQFVDRAVAATAGNSPVIFVPQSFGHEPPEMVYNMSLQGICHGAKGLIWYAWRENATDGLKYNAELREAMAELIARLKALTPSLLNAENAPRRFTALDRNLHGLVMTNPEDGSKYMILVNSSKRQVEFDLSVPELEKDVKKIKGAFDSKTLSCSDGVVKVELDKFESGIYLLSGKAPEVVRLNKKHLSRSLPERGSGDEIRVAPAGGDYDDIQKALDEAEDGDVIKVAEGVYGPVVCDNKLVDIVAEGSVDKTIISGGKKRRALTLTLRPFGSMKNECNVRVCGFTITEGNSLEEKFRPDLGGCVLGGTLERCKITRGRSRFGGGAAYSCLKDCKISRNSAASGGGVAMCRVERSEITLNSATYDGGGAHFSSVFMSNIDANSAARDGGGVHFGTLESCRVTRNRAGRDGGGAVRANSTSVFFSDNTAMRNGGGVFAGTSSHCTIAKNKASGIGGGVAGSVYCGWGVAMQLDKSVVGANLAGNPSVPSSVTNITCRNVFIDVGEKIAGCKTFNIDNVSKPDLRPLKSSEFVDASDTMFAKDALDASGVQRVSGAAPDIGAFEYTSEYMEVSSADFTQTFPLCDDLSAAYRTNPKGPWQKNLAPRIKNGALECDGTFIYTTGSFDPSLRFYSREAFARRRVTLDFSATEKNAGTIFSFFGGGAWAEIDPESGRLKVVFVMGKYKGKPNEKVFLSDKSVVKGKRHRIVIETGRFDGLTNFAKVTLDGEELEKISDIVFTQDAPYNLPLSLELGGKSRKASFIGKIYSYRMEAMNRR